MNTVQQTIATIEERLEQLKKERRKYDHVMLEAGYLVRVGPVHLKFTITSERLVTDPAICGVEQAHLFTKKDAEAIAADTVNGSGTVGEAVHIRQAIEDEIAMVEKLLGTITADQLKSLL